MDARIRRNWTNLPALQPGGGVVAGALAVNADGWSAALTIAGKVGGALSYGNAASPKLALTVTSKSWTTAGVQTTIARTVWATIARRKPFNQQTLRDEAPSGGNVVIQLVLSSMVYSGDTITAVNIASGFFTDSGAGGTGNPNPAGTCTPTNGSTRAYFPPIAMWLNHDRDWATASPYTVSLTCAHRHFQQGQTVRAVQFIATDQHAHTSSVFVSAMTKTSFAGSGLSCSAFTGNIDLTPLTQGDLLTVDCIIYPWVGDAWQASVNGSAYPSPNMTTLRVLNDKTGGYGTAYAYVNGVGGAPAVSTNPATAATTPYDTVVNAAAALKVFNNANFARNNTSGGIIRLTNVVHTMGNCSASVSGPIPLIVEAAVPANKATTILKDPGVSLGNGIPAYTKIRNITLRATNNGVIFLDSAAAGNNDPNALILDGCTFDLNAVTGMWEAWIYRPGQFTMINCDGGDCRQGASFAPNASKQTNLWGCTGSGGFLSSAVYNAVGCKDLAAAIQMGTGNGSAGGTGYQPPTRCLLGWSFLGNHTDGVPTVKGDSNSIAPVVEFGLIGCVLEQSGGITAANLGAYNDLDQTVVTNYLDIANTIVGSRTNALYNEAGTTTFSKLGISALSVHFESNTKADVFGANANLIGGWNFRYRVDGFYRCALYGDTNNDNVGPAEWLAEIDAQGDQRGTNAAPIAAHWVNDQSFTVAGAGNGDYRPLAVSTALAQIPAGLTAFPFDHRGTAVPVNGAAYVGALQA